MITNGNMLIKVLKGGKGSGFHGHKGRPGKRGGSGTRFSGLRGVALDKELESVKDHTGSIATTNSVFKEHDKWSTKLKDSLKDTVSDYTSTDLHLVINNALRKSDFDVMDKVTDEIKDLEDIIRKAPGLSEETKLYRAANSDSLSGLGVGDKFLDKGFGSATLDRNQAVDFKDGDVEMIIIASPKTKGAYVAGLSAFSNEAEFLLNRNTRYEILDIRPGDGARFDKQYIVEIQ